MDQELANILDEARGQIARGVEPNPDELTARIRALDHRDGKRALDQLNRLLAVHRARTSLAAPPRAPARPKAPTYRAKPTIAANIGVRARAEGDAVVLEWDPARGVTRWEARISDRSDARSPYVDRETRTLDAPRLVLALTELPLRVGIAGRNASGRIVQRALVSGLTRSNWNQKWQQRASAS